MNAQKLISLATGVLVFFLAACAFTLSYDALRQVALAAGVNPLLAYLWPLSIDSFMVAACLSSLRASLQGERAWLAWGLVAVFTCLSILFNVSHILPLLPAWLVFAIPPLVVFLAFELLTAQLRGAILRHNAVQSLATLQDAIEQARQELADLQAQADRAEQDRQANAVSKRGGKIDNAQLLETWRARPTITDGELARLFGVSRQAVAQRRAQLEQAGAIRRNGNGIEVLQM